jgi:protein TonB
MFEDSLVESRVFPTSSSKRWRTTLASISFQFAVAAAVIALPLFHPETVPFHEDLPKVMLPLLPKPPAPVVHVQRIEEASSSVASHSLPQPLHIPSLLPDRSASPNEEPALMTVDRGMGISHGLPVGLDTGDIGPHPGVAVASTRASQPLHISSGVSAGMLIAPIRPVYPAIAKAAHIEGMVVVEAIITRTGTIESLHVVSGPMMLQSAAIDAIRAARYQPYRLNGEATEVQTTITVNFCMGG